MDLSIEQAVKSYEEVRFVRFSDVTTAMLELLGESQSFRDVLLCLCSREPDCPRYPYVELLAMELIQKLDILHSVGGIAREWRADIIPFMGGLIRMYKTGTLCATE